MLAGLVIALAWVACARGGEVAGAPSQGLVFVVREGDSTELRRARIDDGATRALTRTPERDESWPYWSQEARRLVFQVAPALASGQSDLVLWDPEHGEQRLTRTPRREERWPVWSPSGDRLVFAFRGGGRPPSGVMSLSLDGGRPVLLGGTQGREIFLRPSFSPDGTLLVAQRRGADGRGSDLWLLEAGRAPQPLLVDDAWFDFKAWFTRDSQSIVFTRRPADGGPGDVMRVGRRGGSPRRIAGGPDSDEHSGRPSPTRDEIVFVSDRSGSAGVYRLDLESGEETVVVDSPERHEFAPRWSPDGERIVVTYTPVETAHPRLVDSESLEASGIQVLSRDGEPLFETEGFMPSWMPPWP